MPMGSCTSIAITKADTWVSSKKINPDQVDLSHFKIIEIIGTGGFAKVYRGVNRITNEEVAIKVADKKRAVKSKSFFKSIWIERNIMSQIDNKFLLPLLYSFQSYYECYLVVPFMKGSDYTHYSRSQFYLKENEVRFYFCQLVLAVEYLHNLNIVHRDIKPRNMLLDSEGNLKLCDYGLAHQFSGKDEFLKHSAGTSSYCAPEMVKKKPYRFSVDIWSMGISLYEMIFQRRPYKNDDHMCDCFERGLKLDFKKNRPCSPEVEDLIQNMLKWTVTDRIGCDSSGISAIKSHKWFQGVDWAKVAACQYSPPYVPRLAKRKIKRVDENALTKKKADYESAVLDSEIQERFENFEFNIKIKSNQKINRKRRRSEKRLLLVEFKKSVKGNS